MIKDSSCQVKIPQLDCDYSLNDRLLGYGISSFPKREQK